MDEKYEILNSVVSTFKEEKMFEEFFDSKNYHQIVIDIVNFVQNIGHRLLTEVFKWMEEKFHKTINKKIWHVHGIRKRLIWSPFGDILIIRRIYKRAARWKTTKILFDSELELQPNKYIQECFAPMFLKIITKTRSYESLSDIFGCNISTSGISRLVMKQDIYLKPKKLREKTEILYVNTDDIYVYQNHGKNYYKRMVLAYTGCEKISKRSNKKRKNADNKAKKYNKKGTRNQLIEKTLFSVDTSISIYQQAKYVEDMLIWLYGDIRKIKLIGDGASWITSYASLFSRIMVEREIDPFHYKMFVKQFLGKKKQMPLVEMSDYSTDYAMSCLLDLKLNRNLNVFGDNIVDSVTGEVIILNEKDDKLFKKIKKFFKSYCRGVSSWHPNAIEGIQSHYVASDLKGRRMFSKNVANKIVTMNIARYNGWLLVSSPYEGINIEDMFKDEFPANLKTSNPSNVPYLDSGTRFGSILYDIIGK